MLGVRIGRRVPDRGGDKATVVPIVLFGDVGGLLRSVHGSDTGVLRTLGSRTLVIVAGKVGPVRGIHAFLVLAASSNRVRRRPDDKVAGKATRTLACPPKHLLPDTYLIGHSERMAVLGAACTLHLAELAKRGSAMASPCAA